MKPEQPKTQPGRRGGTLKADAGPGRPKGSVSITAQIKRLLAADKGEQAKKLAQALIIQAAKGNGTAIREIMNRIDGVVGESLEHSGEVVIRVKRDTVDYPDASSGTDGDSSQPQDV
jgi:hypothetical protein